MSDYPLYPALVKPRNWLIRLIRGRDRRDQPVARLVWVENTLSVEHTHTYTQSVSLVEPVGVQLMQHPDSEPRTLHLIVADTVALRSVWPSDALVEPLPEGERWGLWLRPADFHEVTTRLDRHAHSPLGTWTHPVSPQVLSSLESPGEAKRCTACGSMDLAAPFPEVWHCLKCDYSLGSGQEARARAEREAEMAETPEEERHALCLNHLSRARTGLLEVARDMRRYHDYEVEGITFMEDALRQVGDARHHVTMACELGSLPPAGLVTELGALLEKGPHTLAMRDLGALGVTFEEHAEEAERLFSMCVLERSLEERGGDSLRHLELAARELTRLMGYVETLRGHVVSRDGMGGAAAMASEFESTDLGKPRGEWGVSLPDPSAQVADRMARRRAKAQFRAHHNLLNEVLVGGEVAWHHLYCAERLSEEIAELTTSWMKDLELVSRHPQRVLGDVEQQAVVEEVRDAVEMLWREAQKRTR